MKTCASRSCAKGKLRNSLVLLRRNGAEGWEQIKLSLPAVERVSGEDTLRGVEGNAAEVYFKGYASLLPEGFRFCERTRRPPRDPGNSLLSLAYTLLVKETESALQIAGLDPYVGSLHYRSALRAFRKYQREGELFNP